MPEILGYDQDLFKINWYFALVLAATGSHPGPEEPARAASSETFGDPKIHYSPTGRT